ncbi:MAG: outer membrane lipoprotein-sorting protein [Spirochaetales bacterium]|nr:outer membrane lipoprotein-sorting protein [Spirochaetales bacterium]
MKTSISILAVILAAQTALFADTDIEGIVRRADALLRTERVHSVSEMIIYRSGKARPAMNVEGYEMNGEDGSMSLTVYRSPAKMKGTAYLMIGDDIWVRFGNTGRIRKLSSSAKKNSAGGSDFSYNDMNDTSQGLSEKYSPSLLDDNTSVDGAVCYKVQFSAITGKETPYEKLVCYITKDDYRYVKIEYFENSGHIKTLTLSDWRKEGDRSYPYLITMHSHTSPSYTEYRIVSITFDSPLVTERLFTQTYLGQIK